MSENTAQTGKSCKNQGTHRSGCCRAARTPGSPIPGTTGQAPSLPLSPALPQLFPQPEAYPRLPTPSTFTGAAITSLLLSEEPMLARACRSVPELGLSSFLAPGLRPPAAAHIVREGHLLQQQDRACKGWQGFRPAPPWLSPPLSTP